MMRGVLVAFASLALTMFASGQALEEPGRPSMSRADVDRCIAALDFADESQAATFRALYDDMAAACVRAVAETRRRIDEAAAAERTWREEHPGEEPWMGHAIDFGRGDAQYDELEERVRIDERFESDVAAILTSEQRLVWIDFTRAIRRRQQLPGVGFGPHERDAYDLAALLDEVLPAAERDEPTHAALAAYIERMDSALRRWQAEAPHAWRAMRASAMGRTEHAAGGNEQKRKRNAEAGETLQAIVNSVSAINEQSLARLCECLPPEQAERLRDAVDRAVYPELFRPCVAEIARDAVRLAPDVAPDQREAIEAMFADCVPHRDQLRRQIVTVVRKWERGEYPLNRELKSLYEQSQRSGGEPDVREQQEVLLRRHPANPLLEQRHALAIETVRRMRSIFSESEIDNMPEAVKIALTAW